MLLTCDQPMFSRKLINEWPTSPEANSALCEAVRARARSREADQFPNAPPAKQTPSETLKASSLIALQQVAGFGLDQDSPQPR
jgi:hypothetical protein